MSLMNGWAHRTIALLGSLSLAFSPAFAARLEIPPAPSPLASLGISIQGLLDQANLGAYDPIVILVRERRNDGSLVTCPQGTVDVTDESVRAASGGESIFNGSGAPSGTSGGQPKVCASNDISGDNAWLQWIGAVFLSVLSQFTGDQLANFIGGNKDEVRLGELLASLCSSWGQLDAETARAIAAELGDNVNYLGGTLCALSDFYNNSVLTTLRMAYFYGDEALNTYLSRLISAVVGELISPVVSDLKKRIVVAYNSLPFAEPLYNASKSIQAVGARVASELQYWLYLNARGRTKPFVDSTVAWLLAQGIQAQEQVNSQLNQGGTVTTSGLGATPRGNPGEGGGGAVKISPDQLALIMASSSSKVLQELQAIGQEQEKAKAKMTQYIADVNRQGETARRAALEGLPEVNPEVPSKIAKEATTQTDTRDLLVSLIQVSSAMAKEQLTQGKRLEALVASMVEEAAKTNAVLTKEATKAYEEQIQALEELKQQILSGLLTYSNEAAVANSVLENTVYLIGSLGVEKAGILLTEEEYNDLVAGQRSIPVP